MRRLVVIVLLASLVASMFAIPATSVAADCQFVHGFKLIKDQIPDVVGDCLENEHHNPANGDGLQATTGGLLVWRKSDNWTAFTDGYRTWVNGPNGLQQRLNTERFPWENDPVAPAPQQPVAAMPTLEQCMTMPLDAPLPLLEACITVLESALNSSPTAAFPSAGTDGAEWVRVEQEIDSLQNLYVIQRRNGERWLIEHGVGCLSLPVGRQVLVVSPGLFAGVGSYIVKNESSTCRIWEAARLR